MKNAVGLKESFAHVKDFGGFLLKTICIPSSGIINFTFNEVVKRVDENKINDHLIDSSHN
jgi:hypothetical protein